MNKKKHNLFYTQDGHLEYEKVELEKLLVFLQTTFFGKLLQKIANTRFISWLCGLYQDSFLSKRRIAPFIKKHNIDTSEFKKSIEQFTSFNDFFVREIKPGSRKIDYNSGIIVSPADSKLLVIEDISQDVPFFIKNKKFDLVSFLRNNTLAKKYEGGVMMIFRLAPYDYHRFHFPCDCVAQKPNIINGWFNSVNPIAYQSGSQPLIENERHLIELRSENFGDIAFVSVGARFVGKVVETFEPNKHYKKGDECGYFSFGGSTVVLLFKKGIVKPKEIFVKHSREGYETQVRMGQAVTE